MNKLLKEFKELLDEKSEIPPDELRDYYLVPLKAFISSNQGVVKHTLDEQTPLMMVIKKIIKKDNHPIRLNNLESLCWDIIEKMDSISLNQQDRDGNSVIHYTCFMECFSVGLLDFMKEMGANFSLINKKGETPLILVSDSNSLDDLKFIHAYTDKELINHKDMFGYTALMKAFKAKKINNIFFLLEQGADLLIKDNNDESILDWIEKHESIRQTKFWSEIENIIEPFIKKNKFKLKLYTNHKPISNFLKFTSSHINNDNDVKISANA